VGRAARVVDIAKLTHFHAMRFGLRITDRYICREFFGTLAGVLSACAVILLIARIFEDFEDMMKNHVSFLVATKYFLLMLPFRLLEIVPLATVLAVIFSVGTLARNREMLAITSGGQSPYRSALPVFVSTMFISLLVIILNETLVPRCQERANYYQEVFINDKSEISLTRHRNIFEKGVGNTFFGAQEFNTGRKEMYEVLIFELSDNPTFWRYSLRAASARLIKRIDSEHDLWRFEKASEHFYDERGRPTKFVHHPEPFDVELEANLDQYLSSRKDPEQMNVAELTRYIRTLKMRGEDVSIYSTDWYLKLAFPFSTVILGMIAFALALRAHIASLPLSFGFGILLTMIFYAMAALGQTMGHIGLLRPIVASIGPLAIFMALGIYLIRRSGFAS
jgi:lipopolysaccharide export system permease protein